MVRLGFTLAALTAIGIWSITDYTWLLGGIYTAFVATAFGQ